MNVHLVLSFLFLFDQIVIYLLLFCCAHPHQQISQGKSVGRLFYASGKLLKFGLHGLGMNLGKVYLPIVKFLQSWIVVFH